MLIKAFQYDILDSESKHAVKVSETNQYEFLKEDEFRNSFGQGEEKDTFSFYIDGIDSHLLLLLYQNLDSTLSKTNTLMGFT